MSIGCLACCIWESVGIGSVLLLGRKEGTRKNKTVPSLSPGTSYMENSMRMWCSKGILQENLCQGIVALGHEYPSFILRDSVWAEKYSGSAACIP